MILGLLAFIMSIMIAAPASLFITALLVMYDRKIQYSEAVLYMIGAIKEYLLTGAKSSIVPLFMMAVMSVLIIIVCAISL